MMLTCILVNPSKYIPFSVMPLPCLLFSIVSMYIINVVNLPPTMHATLHVVVNNQLTNKMKISDVHVLWLCISARDVADPSTALPTMFCKGMLQAPCNIHLVDHACKTIPSQFWSSPLSLEEGMILFLGHFSILH